VNPKSRPHWLRLRLITQVSLLSNTLPNFGLILSVLSDLFFPCLQGKLSAIPTIHKPRSQRRRDFTHWLTHLLNLIVIAATAHLARASGNPLISEWILKSEDPERPVDEMLWEALDECWVRHQSTKGYDSTVFSSQACAMYCLCKPTRFFTDSLIFTASTVKRLSLLVVQQNMQFSHALPSITSDATLSSADGLTTRMGPTTTICCMNTRSISTMNPIYTC
jgi:hypothetical protein